MRKYFQSVVLLLSLIICASCSSDDEGDEGSSSLTLNGVALKIHDIEGEYDPEGSWNMFTFWVNNDLLSKTSIIGTIPFDANFVSGEDITNECSLTIYNGEDCALVIPDAPNTKYRSGKVFIDKFDYEKRTITIRFEQYKCLSDLKNDMVINGTLNIAFSVIKYGTGK